MWMVYEILYSLFERKYGRFCWGINVYNEAHGEIVKIIEILDSDVYEYTNQVIE